MVFYHIPACFGILSPASKYIFGEENKMGNSSNVESYAKYERGNGIHFVPVWRIVGFSGANLAVNLCPST